MIATWEDFFLIKGRASKLKVVEAERNPVDLYNANRIYNISVFVCQIRQFQGEMNTSFPTLTYVFIQIVYIQVFFLIT